jgi:DNA-binding NarL/FixJ family response regulator
MPAPARGSSPPAAHRADEDETRRPHHCDAAAHPTGTAGALVIKAPLVVAALRDYFEMLWDRASPLNSERPAASGSRLSPAQQAVLQLMAEGLRDDAIGRRAGMSTTTVRRHIAAIMERLDVASRFAAGAAAQRRGWIG